MLDFFQTVSALGKGQVLFALYAVVFNVVSKPAALYLACAITTTNFLMNELKSLYSHPRPYWVDSSITSFSTCHTGFGNPSGHMVNNVFLWNSLYLHFYADVGVKPRRMSVFCTAYIIKMAATAIVLTYLMFVAFSRVYLGAHGYN
jgi:membrane-associated phospholipid phosphatase